MFLTIDTLAICLSHGDPARTEATGKGYGREPGSYAARPVPAGRSPGQSLRTVPPPSAASARAKCTLTVVPARSRSGHWTSSGSRPA